MRLRSQRLSNGLAFHQLEVPGSSVVSAALAFPAGSRFERAGQAGLAHFSEHAAFRGSVHYPSSRAIRCRADSIGADYNATTTHDYTSFQITARTDAFLPALELLCDIAGSPLLDTSEVALERGVVVQEIQGYNDSLGDVAEQALQSAIYGRHPLGHSVLGSDRSVRRFTAEDVRAFRARCYGAGGAHAVLAGATTALDTAAVSALLQRLPVGVPAAPPVPVRAFGRRMIVRERDDINQTYMQLAFSSAIDPRSPRHMLAMRLYADILGGSVTSRLWEELREQQALCYTVRAYDYSEVDCPQVRVRAELRSTRCLEAFARIRAVVGELAAAGPTRDEVERARAHLLGMITITNQDMETLAGSVVENALGYGQPPAPYDLALLGAISFDEVAAVAATINPSPAVGIAGPHRIHDFGPLPARLRCRQQVTASPAALTV